jgi:hypothetical protein
VARSLGAVPVYLFLILSVAGLALVAVATQRPDAAWIERAEGWPLVGGLAERFRAAYLPPDPSAPDPVDDPGPPQVVVIRRGADGWVTEVAPDGAAPEELSLGDPDRLTAAPVDWLVGGEVLRAEPSPDATEVATTRGIANVAVLETRAGWARVRYRQEIGWVERGRLAGVRARPDAPPPLGDAPEPVVPVPGRPADPDRLARAAELLGRDEPSGRLGPYPLWTDVDDPALVAFLGTLAGDLERAYRRRFGLGPRTGAAASVVLFARRDAYRQMVAAEERLAGRRARGHAGHGLAVLYAGGRPRAEIAETLAHELVHLVNRRAVGPALPPWLDEGLAEELAQSATDASGRLLPGTLGGSAVVGRDQVRLSGGRAAAPFLAAQLPRAPSLPDLLALDWDEFTAPSRSQVHYAQSALFVRFLLDGDGGRHAGAFRAFLEATAEGEQPTAEALRERLGIDWETLEGRFELWVQFQATEPRVRVAE